MKAFHYGGTYKGDENALPQREHPEGSVAYKEPEDMKKLSVVMNVLSILIGIVLFAIVGVMSGTNPFHMGGLLVFLLTLIPHEFLHGICFRGDVYMYQNLKQGMLFVTSTEDISKGRFIFLSLLPNIVFGLIPFVVFLIRPDMVFFGALGAMGLSAGAGDYYNVYNTLTQVPNGAQTYLSGMHSYWYIPKDNK